MNPGSLRRKLRKINGPDDFANKVDIDIAHRVQELVTQAHRHVNELLEYKVWNVNDTFCVHSEVESMDTGQQTVAFTPSWECLGRAESINRLLVADLKHEYGIDEDESIETLCDDDESKYQYKIHFTNIGISFVEKWRYNPEDYDLSKPVEFALEIWTYSDGGDDDEVPYTEYP